MSVLDDPDNIRWTWASSGRLEREKTFYDAARVRILSDGSERVFNVGDAVYVAADGGVAWVAHLVEMFERTIGAVPEDDDLVVIDENNASKRMRCTLRWFYNPADVDPRSAAERARAGIPSSVNDELYFSDHIEREGSNGLEVIEGRTFLVDTRHDLERLRAQRPPNFWPGDQLRMVRCFYGNSAADPPPIRQLAKGELATLLANPATEYLYNRLTRPSKYGSFAAVLKGTRKRRPAVQDSGSPALSPAVGAASQYASFSVDDEGIPLSFGPKRAGRQGLWGRKSYRKDDEEIAPLLPRRDDERSDAKARRRSEKRKKTKLKKKAARHILVQRDDEPEVVEQSGRRGASKQASIMVRPGSAAARGERLTRSVSVEALSHASSPSAKVKPKFSGREVVETEGFVGRGVNSKTRVTPTFSRREIIESQGVVRRSASPVKPRIVGRKFIDSEGFLRRSEDEAVTPVVSKLKISVKEVVEKNGVVDAIVDAVDTLLPAVPNREVFENDGNRVAASQVALLDSALDLNALDDGLLNMDLDGAALPELSTEMLEILDPVHDSIVQMKEILSLMSKTEQNAIMGRLDETIECVLEMMKDRMLTFEMKDDQKMELAHVVFEKMFHGKTNVEK